MVLVYPSTMASTLQGVHITLRVTREEGVPPAPDGDFTCSLELTTSFRALLLNSGARVCEVSTNI